MAQADCYLKIDGVTGESDDDKHSKEIVVSSWSWGENHSGSAQSAVGKGGGSGRVVVRDLQITKSMDSSSPTLLQACASHKHFPTAILTCRVQGEKPLEYCVITFTEVVISSIHVNGHDGGGKPTENVTLSFSKYGIDYTPQNADGSGGAKVHGGWNVATNASA
jgi:type VI secretion system secreted protein Hcp